MKTRLDRLANETQIALWAYEAAKEAFRALPSHDRAESMARTRRAFEKLNDRLRAARVDMTRQRG